jgi:chemosensory pili system protein ChpA (sensor histidine kinase/response regulator)
MPNVVAKREKAKEQLEQAKQQDMATDSRRVNQESIKVPSLLLETLVNLAGETSISRGRIEQEVNDFSFTLDEMTNTIDRLRDLLRRLDLETEAQILSSYEKEGHVYDADFDPLEMDQYSVLNQLSRSLGESASDLLDLKSTLLDKTRDTETLLNQQARINTELQEGLMKTRMVPFSRMTPRLRRIVRQISSEVGKEAELEVVNAEGELDRSILERMVTPLEHMLRNAVDHGLETPSDRTAAGKNRKGRITLHFAREGGEVVLRLSDDGKGIDYEKVRAKAIEKGMMTSDAALSDTDILQFIFKAGFSTASSVTQISGRGVGMDVVYSEIKQMGGTMKLHSAPGVGTQFTIRLPFTVSVNRALMVRVGEDAYAIPLTHIEGIVRVPPEELQRLYESGESFTYAGQDYNVHYLGYYVHGINVPHLSGLTRPLPVMLVRGGERTIALQVDTLIGSREIVVKSVGPQLSSVSGISGATILGDGSVVIILDLLALIRAARAEEDSSVDDQLLVEKVEQTSGPKRSTPLVLVVDDSVTVRKVTTRLLERHGMDVITAKDGVDAMAQLHETKPDVMLLDIEMPRMDGFEVATQVRHDERLKDLAIIMITSRGGEKHKNRAFEIGVNQYMGKPFQEKQLLETIESLMPPEMAAQIS